jgi:hypothetical protein
MLGFEVIPELWPLRVYLKVLKRLMTYPSGTITSQLKPLNVRDLITKFCQSFILSGSARQVRRGIRLTR